MISLPLLSQKKIREVWVCFESERNRCFCFPASVSSNRTDSDVFALSSGEELLVLSPTTFLSLLAVVRFVIPVSTPGLPVLDFRLRIPRRAFFDGDNGFSPRFSRFCLIDDTSVFILTCLSFLILDLSLLFLAKSRLIFGLLRINKDVSIFRHESRWWWVDCRWLMFLESSIRCATWFQPWRLFNREFFFIVLAMLMLEFHRVSPLTLVKVVCSLLDACLRTPSVRPRGGMRWWVFLPWSLWPKVFVKFEPLGWTFVCSCVGFVSVGHDPLIKY